MKHFEFPARFRAVYDEAVKRYASGQRGPQTFFSADERAFLAANGISPQSVYDYAEDHLGYGGEPGYEHALLIETVRRDYFLNVQHGRASSVVLDLATIPGKADAVRGIAWLPRLMPKALAKLRGELPSALMYCCGGDRNFFQQHNILPAEFLSLVWRHENDLGAIPAWVEQRRNAQEPGAGQRLQ